MDKKDRTLKKRQLWILLAGFATFCAAFWRLNFRMATSNTESEKNVMTAGIGAGLPDAMQRREKITLVLLGEDPLILALEKAMIFEMNKTGLGDIKLAPEIGAKHPGPVLVIEVGRPGVFWTPFFATSQSTIQVVYSSSGDTTIIGDAPATMDNQNGPALSMYSEYQVSDRSWGLISRPGYYQTLAEYLARQIVSTLKDLYG
jgi:hypothetical protein